MLLCTNILHTALQDFRATLAVDLLNIHHGSPLHSSGAGGMGPRGNIPLYTRGEKPSRQYMEQQSPMQFQLCLQMVNWRIINQTNKDHQRKQPWSLFCFTLFNSNFTMKYIWRDDIYVTHKWVNMCKYLFKCPVYVAHVYMQLCISDISSCVGGRLWCI